VSWEKGSISKFIIPFHSRMSSPDGKKTTRIKVAKFSILTLVPYYNLAKFLDGINIGTLLSMETLCEDSGAKINGYYRDLKEFPSKIS
jgi:hypothetical protein